MENRSKLTEASRTWKLAAYVLMWLFVVLTVFPLLWLGYSSLKPHEEIMQHPMGLPLHPSLDNFRNAWVSGQLGVALLNSVVYTCIATVATLFLALGAGFGLTKFPYKSRKFFLGAFAFGLMIAMHAVIIPLFLMEVRLHLVNTRIGVVIPYIAFDLPMSVLIAVSYLRGIPDAIIESAEIDGAKYRWIFWRIVVPLCTPVVATMVILSFLRHWNEFLFVFIFTTKAAMKSLPVAITQFAGRLNFEYGLQYASLVVGILPMIVFYLAFHAQLIKGFGEGSLKE